MHPLRHLAIPCAVLAAMLGAAGTAHADPTNPTPPDRGWQVELGISPFVALGIAPGVAFGAALHAGIYWPSIPFSIAAEVHVDGSNPAPVDVFPEARVKTTQVGGTIVPCWRPLFFLVCGVATYSEVYASATGIDVPQTTHRPTFRAGGRVGLGASVRDHLGLRLHGDVLGTMAPVRIGIDKQEVWRTPGISGDVAATLLGSF